MHTGSPARVPVAPVSMRAVLVVAVAACTRACRGSTERSPERPGPCVESSPGSSGIVGDLHVVQTNGPVAPADFSWAASSPHAGVIVVQPESTTAIQRDRVGADGRFSLRTATGRYRVIGYIPGVHDQGEAAQP